MRTRAQLNFSCLVFTVSGTSTRRSNDVSIRRFLGLHLFTQCLGTTERLSTVFDMVMQREAWGMLIVLKREPRLDLRSMGLWEVSRERAARCQTGKILGGVPVFCLYDIT